MRAWVFASCAALVVTADLSAEKVANYQLYPAVCSSTRGVKLIALRRFTTGEQVRYLVLDPQDLTTSLRDDVGMHCVASSWEVVQKEMSATPYFRALEDAALHSDPLQDAGITHFLPTQRGVDLTIDLCPSKRPLDRVVIADLLNEFSSVERPVPLSIAVTGVWMHEHPDDLRWLLDLQGSGRISIDWINHTYNHRTNDRLPARENFMLEKGTDVNFEILETERAMIENGMTPSVFFRFPGLVSDRQLVGEVTQYGLIPVGSDAWLSKNQWPKAGSIVLIHANGNDPIGVKDFLKLLRTERDNVLKKRWLLYDLRESMADELGTGAAH